MALVAELNQVVGSVELAIGAGAPCGEYPNALQVGIDSKMIAPRIAKICLFQILRQKCLITPLSISLAFGAGNLVDLSAQPSQVA